MSNNLLTISMITKESLRQLKNHLGFTKNVNRQYDDSFANKGAKIGSVINIRKPVRYQVSNGPSLVLQDVTDQFSALTLSSQKHVGFQFNSKDLTLSIDEFKDRYIVPAVTALANQVDVDGLAQVENNVANFVGTPGTTPNTALLMLQAGQKLDEYGSPIDGRSLCINPAAQAAMVDALKGLFQSSEKIAEQYEKGYFGTALGFKWLMAQNIKSHTIGALGGTPLVSGNSQSGSSIVTRGWTANIAVLNAGDVITFANVNAVNPQTRLSSGALKQFVVQAPVSSDSNGNATISISPAIVLSGSPYQNVDNGPIDGAAIKTFGQVSSTGGVVSPINVAFHKDAFVLGCADLELPGGVDMAARASDPDSGLSVRMVRAYDINNDVFPCRLDILYGWQTVYPELACRVQG